MSTIQAVTRDIKTSIQALRSSGKIPAVFYGLGKQTTSVAVDRKEFEKVWKQAGESSTIQLSVDNKPVDVLIHEVQFDPIKGTPIHVDFLVVDMNKPIHVAVALEFIGVAPAVKNGTGTLVKVMHEIEISALPKNLPHVITVDLTKLETINSHITVGDLALPTGVTLVTKDNEIVVSVAEQKEEVESASGPIDLSAIEVEKKGKKEVEGEAGEAETK